MIDIRGGSPRSEEECSCFGKCVLHSQVRAGEVAFVGVDKEIPAAEEESGAPVGPKGP